MKYLIAALVLVALAYAAPLPPRWPAVFSQDFNEKNTYPVVGSFYTQGKFFYDAINKRYRVDRDNGKGDRYCWIHGWNILWNQPCSHIVSEGKRFLWYPEQQSCCYCCGSEHGCGILRQDWLKDATFIGEVEIDGQKAFKWDKQGLQSNFYFETTEVNPEDRVQLQTNQGDNDQMTFERSTFDKALPTEIFDLPRQCKVENTCALASVCTAARLGLAKLSSAFRPE